MRRHGTHYFKMMSIYCLFFLILLQWGNCANILYVMPFTSKSHYIMLKPIGLELARRGHNVTVITTYSEKNPPPNYHQVLSDDKNIWELIADQRPNVFTMVDLSAEKFHEKIFWEGGLASTEVTLNSTPVQEFLRQDNKFDLVLCEQFFQEAMYSLAYKYNAPLALVTTYGNCMRHNIAARNPLQLATVVSEFLDVKDPTSFPGRFRNFYFSVYEFIWWKYWYLGKQDQLAKKYIPNLPQNLPGLYEMQGDASLMLLNSHYSIDPPAAYLPNIVEIGGIHLAQDDVSPLPEDLQIILDNAKDGVVYVNFGSNVRSTELPKDKKNAFLNVFRHLKQTVLWKWEDDNLENKPDNLVVRKWMPQKQILSHPNIKVFISHGGLIGTQEAVFHGVPIVGIPIYADQYNNLLIMQNIGFGKILQFHDINENTLESTLHEVLKDDTYTNRAKEVSNRFKDRPMSPLDTAMYWIEFIIRNKGAEYMKNPARQLNWIAYNMFDVYAFVLFTVLTLLYVFINVFKIMKRSLKAIDKKPKKGSKLKSF